MAKPIVSSRDMLKYYVLAFDPSGAYEKGKGTTGWCVMDCTCSRIIQIGTLKATDYPSKYEYWDAHIQLIRKMLKQYGDKLAISIEDYILYANKAEAQVNSNFETVRLIGIIEHYCWNNGVHCRTRLAATAKTRYTDDVLVYKKLIKPCLGGYIVDCANDHLLATHELDAIRHAMYYTAFENVDKGAILNEQHH